jgi:hypothetical protein
MVILFLFLLYISLVTYVYNDTTTHYRNELKKCEDEYWKSRLKEVQLIHTIDSLKQLQNDDR